MQVFVTLVTSESYLPGALTLLKSIKKYNTSGHPVWVITTIKNPQTLEILTNNFDKVIQVNPITFPKNFDNLQVLDRPDLTETLTKLHVFGLEDVEEVVFLDADTLVLTNVEDLFTYIRDADFAACPDIGWPDCFNSGVMVLRPSISLYQTLMAFAESNTSFDGGDQGLLNAYYSSWSSNNEKVVPRTNRIPFVYNVTPSTSYSYLPAFHHFASQIKIVHFIGRSKPWLWNKQADGSLVRQNNTSDQTMDLVSRWWAVFDEFKIGSLLSGMILDRDWTRYNNSTTRSTPSPSHLERHYPSHTPSEQLSQDLANYNISWNTHELGPYKHLQPKIVPKTSSSNNLKSSLKKTVEIPDPNSLTFSTQRPPSPTKRVQLPDMGGLGKDEISLKSIGSNSPGNKFEHGVLGFEWTQNSIKNLESESKEVGHKRN